MSAADLSSGKGDGDENFPVASWLIAKKHRPAVLGFYRFARTADDVADHASASPDEKLRLLETMRASLAGESTASPEGTALRAILAARNLSDRHALELLEAFRRDVTKLRYADWDELMDYCRYSAMPVGRFMLDVHGESQSTWPASDALCSALQIINHLQDCAKDFRSLNRVYIPLDSGIDLDDLAKGEATPALRALIIALTRRTAGLLAESKNFAAQIRDSRLALDVSVIQTLAEDLIGKLLANDPLSQRIHHSKFQAAALLAPGLGHFLSSRLHPKHGAAA
jgi:squalene synthase HpnC